MSKPTLVQSLLKQPSQKYTNANLANQKKEYYSTKQEMARIAAQPASRGGADGAGITRYNEDQKDAKYADKPPMTPAKGANPPSQRPQKPPTKLLELPNDSDSELDVFFTPNSSPRTSMASSVATITFPSSRRPSRRSLNSLKAESSPLPLQIPLDPTPAPSKLSSAVPSTRTPASNARNALSTASSISSTSLEGHSVFSDYVNSADSITTPYQSESGRSAPVRSTTTSTDAKWRSHQYTDEDWAKEATWLGKSGHSGSTGAKAKAVSASASITASTPAANLGAGHTKKQSIGGNSQPAPNIAKGKERETKPPERGKEETKKPRANPTTAHGQTKYVPPRQPHTFSAFAPVSSVTATNPPANNPTITSSPASGSRSASTQSRLPATSAANGASPSKYTNSPTSNTASAATSTSTKPTTAKYRNQPSTTANNHSSMIPKSSTQLSPPPNQHPQRNTAHVLDFTDMPTITPLTRGMDALLEEDEDGPLTPRMEAKALKAQNDAPGWDWGSSSQSSTGTPPTTTTSGGRLRHTTPDIRRRRSRSLDSSTSSSSTSPSPSNSISGSMPARGVSTPKTPSAPKTLTDEVHALVANFAAPGALPSKGTQGYTGLVLPRAPAPSSAVPLPHSSGSAFGRGGREGRVDLTRTGVAQTTMATVEVVRGLGATAGGSGVLGFLGLGRRRSLSASAGRGRGPAPVPVPTGAPRASVDGAGPDRGARGHVEPPSTTPLGFTAYRAPPGYVASTSVLVQVWAVGLDGVDGRLVGVRFGAGGSGLAGSVTGEEDVDVEARRGDESDADDDVREPLGANGHAAARSTHGHNDDGVGDAAEETDDEELTQTETTPTKKNPLAALGRSISLRLARGAKKKEAQRSASAVVHGSKLDKLGGSPPKRPQHQHQPHHSDPHTRASQTQTVDPRQISRPKRSLSFSLKRNNTAVSNVSTVGSVFSTSPGMDEKQKRKGSLRRAKTGHVPEVGYIPGRSFVGRVLECGWEVRDEVVRKGEWVVGLLDVRKGGALSEFIVVDRHRVHRVPHPRKADGSSNDTTPTTPVWAASPTSPKASSSPTLSLEELALLPLSGLPAYRAVRTFAFAFSSTRDGHSNSQFDFGSGSLRSSAGGGSSDHELGYRRRALVLRGHDGAGAMAVQMLAKRGWRVSVHVPFSSIPANVAQDVVDAFMHSVENCARDWGADEVIFDDGDGSFDDGRGAAVRVMDSLREDGDVFDAVLDTVGGKDVWEAGERLLRSPGSGGAPKRRGIGQFTTMVGDWPERVLPTAKDNLRSGFRAMRMGSTDATHAGANGGADGHGKVGYAWVSVAQDVDWEGEGVAETLGTVVRLALEDGVRLSVVNINADTDSGVRQRVLPFEKSPYVFVDNGPLGDGGTVVVKIAG